MIEEIIERFDESREKIKAEFGKKHFYSYKDILEMCLTVMYGDYDEYSKVPDYEKIHEIDDGHYQGTLVFLIPEKTYQPSDYFLTTVDYGSCSGCDTLMSINGYEEKEDPDTEQVSDYMTLALHMIQKMKKISSYD